MRLWTAKVAEEWGHKCAVCGSGSTPNAHHLENRNTCRALRYDTMNGILLCPSHHKFGKDSAHKGGLWFADWLRRNHPGRLVYVLAHRNDEVNLNNRETLARIEATLRAPVGTDPFAETKAEDDGRREWPYAGDGLPERLDWLFGTGPKPDGTFYWRLKDDKDTYNGLTHLVSAFTLMACADGMGKLTDRIADLAKAGMYLEHATTHEKVPLTAEWLTELYSRYKDKVTEDLPDKTTKKETEQDDTDTATGG